MSLLVDGCDKFAEDWVGGVYSGRVLVPMVARALADGCRVAHALTGKNDSEDDWARKAFGLPQGIPGEVESEELARRMRGILPEEARSLSSGMSEDEDEPVDPDDEEPDDVDSLMQETKAPQADADAASTFSSFGSAVLGTLPGSPFDPNDPIDLIRQFIEFLKEQLRRRGNNDYVAALVKSFKEELMMLPIRLAFAKGLAVLYRKSGLPLSDKDTGREVHKVIQMRYVDLVGTTKVLPRNMVVIERRVYVDGLFWARLRAASQLDITNTGNYALYALRSARISRRSKKGHVRDDIVDMTTTKAMTWEIKPFSDAPDGIIQELYYRLAYNYWAAVWINGLRRYVDPPLLEVGEDWKAINLGLLAPFLHPKMPTRMVAVWTFDLLPGMVLYALADLKDAGIVAAPALLKAFEKDLQKYLDKARKKSDASAPQGRPIPVLNPARAFDSMCHMLMLFFMALAGAAVVLASADSTTPGAGNGVLALFNEDKGEGRPSSKMPRSTARTGHITAVNIPIDKFMKILVDTPKVATPAVNAALKALRDDPKPAPQRTYG